MQLREFLETVVTGESGWFNLSYSNSDGSNWKEEWFGWPDDINSILERADKLSEDYNVYYSPYLFTQKTATKDSAITGRTIVADLDNANALTLPYKPTVLVETSPGRHQSYWVIKNKLEPEEHELLSKRMTYSIPLCDRSGWFIGKRVRLPFTYNYKYNSGPKPVKVVQNNNKLYSSLELEALPQVSLAEKSTDNFDWIHNLPKVGPQSLLQSIRTKISSKVYAQYNHPANDRSAALWALMLSAFRAGLTKEEVYLLASNSANNKFSDLKYRGEIDLAKDVLRAEIEATKKNNTDIRSKILEIRKLAISGVEKNAFLATVVKDYLLTIGSFVNCTDGTAWFIRDDTGQPLPIVHRSGPLQTLIDVTFGINSSERESLYMVSHLITYVSELPAVGTLASVSHYDMDSNTVFVHTGKKDVLKITTDSVEIVTNGYNSIVFPWNTSNEVVTPIYQDSERTWDDILFSNAFDNVIGMTPEEAKSLLRVWFVILLLRNALVARPIMAIFGQPGSGKSTLFRRIYTLLYGRGRSLNSVTTADNFDFAVASDPLVVLDNVDTWEKWLPDRLALSAATSEIVKRKLYTNAETITLKRQALLGITAHNPKFGREDVTDRLLMILLSRLNHFTPETEIISYISANRGVMWGGVIRDVQKVLNYPMPLTGYPQFRVEDFSKFGYWVACALGVGQSFYDVMTKITDGQKSFILEEDQLLIDAIQSMIENRKYTNEFRTPGQLWLILSAIARDPLAFQKQYKNALVLGKKLWTLTDSLKRLFKVTWEVDNKRGTRVWKFEVKE